MDQYKVHGEDERCSGADRVIDLKLDGDEIDRTIIKNTEETSSALVGILQVSQLAGVWAEGDRRVE